MLEEDASVDGGICFIEPPETNEFSDQDEYQDSSDEDFTVEEPLSGRQLRSRSTKWND